MGFAAAGKRVRAQLRFLKSYKESGAQCLDQQYALLNQHFNQKNKTERTKGIAGVPVVAGEWPQQKEQEEEEETQAGHGRRDWVDACESHPDSKCHEHI